MKGVTDVNRPKVLSLFSNKEHTKYRNYNECFSMINVINEKDVFIPCYAYDVNIYVSKEKNLILDIFEETILRIASCIKINDVQNIAKIICLDKDFVKFVCMRLKEKDYLNDDYTINEHGKEILNNNKNLTEDVDEIMAQIFTIQFTGEMLPYVHIGEINYEQIDNYSKNKITIICGSQGNPSKVVGNHLYDESNNSNSPNLDRFTIQNLIRDYNKFAKNSKNFELIAMNEKYGIIAQKNYKTEILLHSKLILQNGNIDNIIVSDGFLMNSVKLQKYIESNHSELIQELLKSSNEINCLSNDNTFINMQAEKYSSLYKLLNMKINNGSTKDEILNKEIIKKQIIINTYSALEWALYTHLKENPIFNMSLYKAKSVSDNFQIILKYASQLKIDTEEKYQYLLKSMDKSKIIAFEKQSIASMYTLLPLTIIQAIEDSSSRFYNVISEFPDLLQYIHNIKSYNDTFKHSTQKDLSISDIEVKELNSRAIKFIELLLPNFCINKDSFTIDNPLDNVSQKRINAEVSLSEELGWEVFQKLNVNIKNELIQISSDKKLSELPSIIDYILILSKVLETLISSANKIFYDVKAPTTKIESLNIIDLEFSTNLIQNKVFNTISDKFYQNATNEKSSTLGAIALVYLAKVGISKKKDIIQHIKDIDFISTIEKIIVLRGHGNNINLVIDNTELKNLRKNVFEIIKFIQ